MKKNLLFWIIALTITLAAAYYQRITGPTYPVSGNFKLNDQSMSYTLERSHGGSNDHLISVVTNDESVLGTLQWKRYKTKDDWHNVEMQNTDGIISGYLPHQPPAGKLVYRIKLNTSNEEKIIPAEPVTIRFKGDVPLAVLIPHIIFIFGAMLLSNRTALECFNADPKLKTYTIWTFALLLIGGMILGPVVQKYAFGEFWTGFPFGTDLTDNKTLIAFIGWFIALIAVLKTKNPKKYILLAAIIMFIIFIIPHSLFGSELDYRTLD
ncbi:MAG: hypothetical protein R6W68_08675 [Ignavibacteriaceae bacterium]